ncbi:MAG TPA: hypothetical protein VM493_04645 [Vicinamibacterales bacterium]|nr:hypothetical protein [Vicinamibacterales bacterium]
MTDMQIRSDNVDVEQIMRQIRTRIREKRGVDYTEDEIKELARVKLEKFLDPTGVRSDLLAQFRRTKSEPNANPNFNFEDTTLFHSHLAIVRFIRRMLQPILKLFFNVNPLINALHIQSDLNARGFRRDELQYELIHNLVLETTRLGIQVKNLKMQVDSMSGRLDFDERRARALEGVVQYRPGAVAPLQPTVSSPGRPAETEAQAAERRTRRRRRRGRRPASARENAGTSFGEAGSASPRQSGGASFGEASATAGAPARENGGASYGEARSAAGEHSGPGAANHSSEVRADREAVERPKPLTEGGGEGG